ncbi:MAG: alginate export family protein [Verrucomicrobiae bacterium]|nr:alginate export family protein [Verrucomicrobiae bacterium]
MPEAMTRAVFIPRALAVLAAFSFPGRPSVHAQEFRPFITRAAGANRVSDRPEYARLLQETARTNGWTGLESADWLDAGIQSRLRYEIRDNDYRIPGQPDDDALLTQNLVYLGVRRILDPLRFAAEFEDARRVTGDRDPLPNEVNETDLLQGHADLYFENVVDGQSLTLMAGRMAFDAVDRRLIARNRFRNAISAFDGFRVRLGRDRSPWEVDAFAVRPVDRDPDGWDWHSGNSWLYGVTGYWRVGSPEVQVEPFWLLLSQDAQPGVSIQRQLHTFGFHAFGAWDSRKWDYDVSIAGQVGRSRNMPHRAWASHFETGYTWDASWRPRLGWWLNYASGDRDPGDGTQQRFDPLFGANFAFYGFSGYFSWQNIVDPAMRFSIQPALPLRAELIYRSFWLASDQDAWVRGLRLDPTGDSGSFVGQELDVRVTYTPIRWVEFEVVYAHFFPGSFVAATGPDPQSNFTYLQAILRF